MDLISSLNKKMKKVQNNKWKKNPRTCVKFNEKLIIDKNNFYLLE